MATIIRTKEELKRFLSTQLNEAEEQLLRGDNTARKWNAGMIEGLERALEAVDSMDTGNAIRRMPGPSPPSSYLNAREEGCLERIWEGNAWKKWLEGSKFQITFTDACRFWGLGHEPKGKAKIDQALHREFDTPLDGVAVKLEGQKELVLSSGQSLTTEDLNNLLKLDSFLQERFLRHLNLLRSRST